jgi:hypothetical protein
MERAAFRTPAPSRHKLSIAGVKDYPVVVVLIVQETSLGEHWIKLTHSGLVEDGSMTAVLENHDAPSRCQRGG